MDLRHLRYFIAVAEEGHLTRAAERLGIEQPSLSRLIKTIEQDLDVQLFRRKPRGVELTDAGRAFLDKARAILASVDQAVVTVKRAARGEQGHISVGLVHTASFHPFVPPLIRAYRESFPLVALTLEELGSDVLIQYLRDERIDVAFIRSLPADSSDLLISRLLEEEVVAALPRGHPLALEKGKRDTLLPVKALANEPFILGRHLTLALHAATIAACHAAGFVPKVAQEIPRTTFNSCLHRRRAWCRLRPSLDATHRDARRFVSPRDRSASAHLAAVSRLAPRRSVGGRSPVRESRQTIGEEFFF